MRVACLALARAEAENVLCKHLQVAQPATSVMQELAVSLPALTLNRDSLPQPNIAVFYWGILTMEKLQNASAAQALLVHVRLALPTARNASMINNVHHLIYA